MNAATTENMSIHAAEAPLLEVKHLKKYFPVKGRALLAKREYVHAVDDVSFEVYPHETLGIVGESGCGKSTLLQTIMRIVPATEGEITFCGKDWLALSKDDLRKLRKEMQIVFQDPYSSLDPRMTIGEAIGEPFEIHTRLDSKEIKDTQALLSSIPVISDRGKTGRERIVLEGDLPNPKNPPTGCRFHTRCRYATPICAREEPELRTCENGTQVACHSPIKI